MTNSTNRALFSHAATARPPATRTPGRQSGRQVRSQLRRQLRFRAPAAEIVISAQATALLNNWGSTIDTGKYYIHLQSFTYYVGNPQDE